MSLLKISENTRDAPAITTWLRLPLTLESVGVIAVLGDFAILVGTALIGEAIYNDIAFGGAANTWREAAIAIISFINFAIVGRSIGLYDATTLRTFRGQPRMLSLAWGVAVAVVFGLVFAAKVGDNFSRGATFVFAVCGWLGLLSWRRLLAAGVSRGAKAGAFVLRPVMLVADRDELAQVDVGGMLASEGYSAVHVVSFDERMTAAALDASLRDAVLRAQEYDVAGVFLLAPWQHRRKIEQIVRALQVLPLPLLLLPDRNVFRFNVRPGYRVGSTTLPALHRPPLSRTERLIKRVFDVVVASCGLALLFPILCFVAAMIKAQSRGPVFFMQTRDGFNGRPFQIVKFRTMTVAENGAVIKQATQHDHRITPLGRVLRKTSVDEIPQLWNVLIGQMSIVGPRPHAVAHNRAYEKEIASYAYRQHVKPGLTGWAQVHGLRGETKTVDQMRRRVEFDLHYINHWSIWLDVRIVWMTVKTMARDPAAY